MDDNTETSLFASGVRALRVLPPNTHPCSSASHDPRLLSQTEERWGDGFLSPEAEGAGLDEEGKAWLLVRR